jgi:hypothetical protein
MPSFSSAILSVSNYIFLYFGNTLCVKRFKLKGHVHIVGLLEVIDSEILIFSKWNAIKQNLLGCLKTVISHLNLML